MAHLDAVNALVRKNEALKFATPPAQEVGRGSGHVIAGGRHGKQCGPGDKSHLNRKTPEPMSCVLHWVEAKKWSQNKPAHNGKPSTERRLW